jgi:hypothetical protein
MPTISSAVAVAVAVTVTVTVSARGGCQMLAACPQPLSHLPLQQGRLRNLGGRGPQRRRYGLVRAEELLDNGDLPALGQSEPCRYWL